MLHECKAVQCVVFDARVLFTPEAATKFTKESALDSSCIEGIVSKRKESPDTRRTQPP